MPESFEPFMSEDNSSKPPSIRDYLTVIFRHKKKVVLFFMVTIIAVTIFVSFQQDLYRSEAKLLVRPGWESANPDPTDKTGDSLNRNNNSPTIRMNTVLDLLKGQGGAEKVVERVGPELILGSTSRKSDAGGNPRSPVAVSRIMVIKALDMIRETGKKIFGQEEVPQGQGQGDHYKAVRILMQAIKAQVVRDTQNISISFTAPDPELAQKIVQEYTGLFLDTHKLVWRNPDSYEHVEIQEKKEYQNLNKIRAELQHLMEETGVTSVENQLKLLEDKIGGLDQEIGQTEVDLKASQAKIKDLKDRLINMPTLLEEVTTSYDYPLRNGLTTQLTLLRTEEFNQSKFTEDSEFVKGIHQQIEKLVTQIKGEQPIENKTTTFPINLTYQQVESSIHMEEASLKSLEAEAEERKKQLSSVMQEHKDLIKLGDRINRLKEELANQEVIYAHNSEDIRQSREEQALEENGISSITVCQPATYPISPEKSKKAIILLGGLIGGIVGGIALAFIFASMDHTLKTPEEVEKKLQLHSLVAIPCGRENRISVKQALKGRTNVGA